MKQDNLLNRITIRNFKYHTKDMVSLVISESILLAVFYAGAVGLQEFSNSSSSEYFMQEDGISRMFISAGTLMVFCGIVLIIATAIPYLGMRIPEYMQLKRMGISSCDLRKMTFKEAGLTYLISVAVGFLLGQCLVFGFNTLLHSELELDIAMGRVSILTYPIICIFAILIYALSFLLTKELEADFRIITNTQETTRKEKLVGRLSFVKILLGIILCIITTYAYSQISCHEAAYLIVVFFIGIYLIGRNIGALLLRRTQKHNSDRYIKNLLKNNRFYYRPNTTSRYILFFSLISFLACFHFGFQIISISESEKPESLYPNDFMCIADSGDDQFFENLQNDYDIEMKSYPMVRVANLDKTERFEKISEIRIQGQQIGISETTYHDLKKALDPAYRKSKLKLDKDGSKIYVVHQQDSATKAQPVDWYYGKSKPNIHIGIPCISARSEDVVSTYYEKDISGEEISSLTGCYSTPKCENIIVFSDEFFKKSQTMWKEIDSFTGYPIENFKAFFEEEPSLVEGPTKLILVKAKSEDVEAIDSRMEALEEAHKYVGNYDSSVKFHYSSKDSIDSLVSSRAAQMMISMYAMILLLVMSWLMLYAMCMLERKEKKGRERFLANMGMPKKARRKMLFREHMVFFWIPSLLLSVASVLFLCDTFIVRMYEKSLMGSCSMKYIYLIVGWTLINLIYFTILYIMNRKVVEVDE